MALPSELFLFNFTVESLRASLFREQGCCQTVKYMLPYPRKPVTLTLFMIFKHIYRLLSLCVGMV